MLSMIFISIVMAVVSILLLKLVIELLIKLFEEPLVRIILILFGVYFIYDLCSNTMRSASFGIKMIIFLGIGVLGFLCIGLFISLFDGSITYSPSTTNKNTTVTKKTEDKENHYDDTIIENESYYVSCFDSSTPKHESWAIACVDEDGRIYKGATPKHSSWAIGCISQGKIYDSAYPKGSSWAVACVDYDGNIYNQAYPDHPSHAVASVDSYGRIYNKPYRSGSIIGCVNKNDIEAAALAYIFFLR